MKTFTVFEKDLLGFTEFFFVKKKLNGFNVILKRVYVCV